MTRPKTRSRALLSTCELLDALAKKSGGASDYRLAKLLGTSTSGVAHYRSGRSSLNLPYALRLAELLEWEPAFVIACVERERAVKDSRLAHAAEALVATWERIGARFRPALPSILLAAVGVIAAGSPAPSEACAVGAPVDRSALYIMSTYGRNRRRRRDRRRLPPGLIPAAA